MVQNKVKEIMSKIFDVNIDSIGDDASPDNIANWDSLHHMNLVVALEENFSIELTEDQTVELLNYKLILEVLKEQGIE